MSPLSIFDWACPPQVTIDQQFVAGSSDYQFHPRTDIRYQARCVSTGPSSSSPRASRADALEELDGHPCETAP